MLIPLPLERLLKQLGRLPGLGPRSAQRVALHLLTHGEAMGELMRSLDEVRRTLKVCDRCGNLGLAATCHVCTDGSRATGQVCVVESVADIWALERAGVYRGRYHVLGGLVNALHGVSPEDLNMDGLLTRLAAEGFDEVILALAASVEGQTTAHILTERLQPLGVTVTALAKGMPVGAAVDYMDEGTLQLALQGRRKIA